MNVNYVRKSAAVMSLALLTVSSAYAQGGVGGGASEGYLKQIAENTRGTLEQLNNLPTYFNGLGVLIKAWLDPDTSDTTAAMQSSFSQLGKLFSEQNSNQQTLLVKLNSDLLNNSQSGAFNMSFNVPSPMLSPAALAAAIPYANDLVYSTLLNKPFIPKDPREKGKSGSVDMAYNYIRNASGINFYHPAPGGNWTGSDAAQSRYQNYYNTVMAAESFNSYILSQQYVDRGQLSELQQQLITQATDSKTWFAVVASENIGFVLRQILMYESQMFVLLAKIFETQKQGVAAQTMTNSLLIAANQLNENMLVSNAQGHQPTT